MPHALKAHNSENQKSIDIKEALIASEIRYRRLFESARDGILILDAETGMIVDVNPFLIELLGYSKEKFLGKAIWEIGFFKDVLENKEKFLELQQKEYVRYDDLPLETFNGLKIHVEFVSNVYLASKKKVIQCNIRDITERKHAEEIIHENEEKFKKITQAANEGIILIDNGGKIVFWNKAAETIFGYSVDEAINQDLHLLLAVEKYLKKSQDGFKAFRETGQGFAIGKTMELEGKRKNGQIFPVELSISAIKIGEKFNAVGMIRDISDRKEWEK
ncbi:MAG: PAS domain-containing protein [Bacteroidetes bacterium]|jgi:PAS domain S-box-containing protein|nr:PAS domain-containing protein [Bacteroidota bacterium]